MSRSFLIVLFLLASCQCYKPKEDKIPLNEFDVDPTVFETKEERGYVEPEPEPTSPEWEREEMDWDD